MNGIKIILPLIIRKARCANQNLCHFSNSGNVNLMFQNFYNSLKL
jgi:hypothetical protein